MNTMPNHLAVNLISGDFNTKFDVNTTMNHIEYNLKPGYLDLIIIQSDSKFGLKEKNASIHLEKNQVWPE